jgi:hypothetical protein
VRQDLHVEGLILGDEGLQLVFDLGGCLEDVPELLHWECLAHFSDKLQ